jgi:hypothetical protein
MLAVLAGGIAVVGAVYTGRTFALTRRGQLTERFTRAVDQLGSDKPDVVRGGIYALARPSPRSPSPRSGWEGPLVLGLGATQMVLFAITMVVAALTVLPGRATVQEGGAHLVLFAAFVFLAVKP